MSTELAQNVAHAGLRAPATSGATSVSVELITGAWPTVPFTALMEDGTSRKEQVLVTGVSGNTLTVTRAQGGTSAVAHDTMSSVDVITTLDDLAILETFLGGESVATHSADTTAVHGITDTSVLLTTTHTAAADPHTGYVLESLYDAKGDLLPASADNTPAKLTVGSNDQILIADSAQSAGVKWGAVPTHASRHQAGGADPLALGAPAPTDQNLTGWSLDPAATNGYIEISTGYLFMAKVVAVKSETVAKLYTYIGVAGNVLTAGQNFAGLYSAAGAKLGETADQTVAWGSTALKSMALAVSVAVTAGTTYYVTLLSNGTNAPQFLRGGALTATNAGLTASPYRFQNESTGSRTALPASSSPAAWVTYDAALWMAMGP